MTLDEKLDNATHAAMDQLGLSVSNNMDTADLLNDFLTSLAHNLGVTGDEGEDEQDEACPVCGETGYSSPDECSFCQNQEET